MEPLLQYLDEHPDWNEENSLRLVREMVEALSACEERKIVHGSISPDSIYVSQDGRFLLGDFHAAQFLNQPISADFADFTAPEHSGGEAGDEKSDQYALGVLLSWLLNGRSLPDSGISPVPESSPELQKVIRTA